MALIVEDGSIVENANSYNDILAIKAFALSRGVTLENDDKIEQSAIKAMDFIESKREQFQGIKVSSEQELQFPRYGVFIDNIENPSNEIPKLLKKAQCQLTMEIYNGIDPMPTVNGPLVKSETVGPIKTEYAVEAGSFFIPEMTMVIEFLKPLFKITKVGMSFTTLRI